MIIVYLYICLWSSCPSAVEDINSRRVFYFVALNHKYCSELTPLRLMAL